MSVANAKIDLERKEIKMLVCVFCENTYPEGTFVCPECKEYKGLMEITEASKTYDFLEYLTEEVL
jgi:predicted ATP-dependent serine protease